MKNINHITVSGNLTADAEKRGKNMPLQFAIACNETRKEGDEWTEYANFFDCVIFGKRADSLKEYLKKGLKVCVSGRLHQSRWEDKDGNPRRAVSIYVDDLEFMAKRGENAKKPETTYDDIPF